MSIEQCILSDCLGDLPPALNSELCYPINGSSAVRTVSNVISPLECNLLIARLNSLGLSPPDFEKSVRDCTRCHTVDEGMSRIMFDRLSPYLPQVVIVDGIRWKLSRFTHHWRYVKYEQGGKFIPHWDGAKMSNYAMTMFTVQIYLNNDFSGGTTRFYMDHTFQSMPTHAIKYGSQQLPYEGLVPTNVINAVAGSALIFNHGGESVLHDGETVASGIKFIMRGDVLYEAFIEDIPSLLKNTAGLIKSWCPETAAVHGTRNFMGQMWVCDCAVDEFGARMPCKHNCDQSAEICKTISNLTVAITNPVTKKIILLSGKRATGKDYIGTKLYSLLTESNISVHMTSFGNINKKLFAEKNNLDYERLLSNREYKEIYRVAMVTHHSELDVEDPLWCIQKILLDFQQSCCSTLIVTDLRVLRDLENFQRLTEDDTKIYTFRITATGKTRSLRGYVFDLVKDNLISETGMDYYNRWTACFDNSANTDFLLQEWLRNTVLPKIDF